MQLSRRPEVQVQSDEHHTHCVVTIRLSANRLQIALCEGSEGCVARIVIVIKGCR